MKPQVIVIRNEEDALVLVGGDGRVIDATSSGYIGMPLTEATAAGISVMRRWDPAIQDNAYPEVIEL